MIDLSVIIVSYNTKKLLLDCLNSIFKQTKNLNYEVIVVDNGSTDGSLEMVRKNFPKVKLMANKENLGFAKANNQGIKKAQGKWILLLNSDTKIKGNALKKLIDFAKTKLNLGVAGPRLLNVDGSFQPSTAPFFNLPRVFLWLFSGDRFLYSSPPNPCQTDWVMGSALMVSQSVVDKIGLLDEKFFMYLEEVEWCYRIKQAGFKVWFCPEAEIIHLKLGGSVKRRESAVLNIYRSLIYFYQKHFASWQLAVLKLLLRTKAFGGWLIGALTNNNYLKGTYAQAFKLAR